jgi:lysozyme
MMGVSSKCIDLVKAFEGCHLEAYKCPAKIPTIGYGTTFYPSGQAVRMGDRISQQQAEAYLTTKCDNLCAQIQQLVNVPLNQNQIDALVSFVYNIGLGAFQDSTLLKLLNQGNYAAAAKEFPRWNKATIDGVKQVLPGLARRRAEERFLFESTEGMAEPIAVELSAEDTVTWLELYRDANGQNLVAAWNGETLVELLELNRALKEDLAAALQQYPNAKNVHVAPADKPIPAGERISLESSTTDIAPPLNPPPDLNGQILRQGSEGATVTWLQERLFDLGYYQGNLDGNLGWALTSLSATSRPLCSVSPRPTARWVPSHGRLCRAIRLSMTPQLCHRAEVIICASLKPTLKISLVVTSCGWPISKMGKRLIT